MEIRMLGQPNLIAYRLAIEIVIEVGKLVEPVKRHDRSPADQLKRAASSILLNVGEGSRRRGGDKTQLFLVGLGSTQETRDALTIAVAWRYLSAEATAKAHELCDREIAVLYRLTHPRA